MKRIGVGIIIVIFLVAFTSSITFADNQQLQQALKTPVSYELPYPGLLPDNFLYPLKAFRDRVVSFFISDSQKKASFDLLQADKRLAAGEDLLQEGGNKSDLISQTLSKGENYFDASIKSIAKAQAEGREVNDFLDRLTKAGIKHEQVLSAMSAKTHGDLQRNIVEDITRVQGFEEEVAKLKLHQ